jgi:hypothetical protein
LFRSFLLALIGYLSTTQLSFSAEEKCTPRAGYFNLQPGQHFAGMFRIPLDPTDFRSPSAAQHHLVFSVVWGQLLKAALVKATSRQCGAFMVPNPFPDLQVFLFGNQADGRIDQEKSVCPRALEDVLQHSQPDGDLIKQEAAKAASFREPAKPSSRPLAATLDAANILEAAFPFVYKKDSLLHALASVAPDAYRSVDAADLRVWIQRQRSSGKIRLESISHCRPSDPDLSSGISGGRSRQPSEILPPSWISISRETERPIPPGPLRYAILMGRDKTTASFANNELQPAFCNQERSFLNGDGSSLQVPVTVRLRCLDRTLYDLDNWSLIYCDPNDCTSERTEKAVITAAAGDPAISSLAIKNLDTEPQRELYLITIK